MKNKTGVFLNITFERYKLMIFKTGGRKK